MGRVKKKRVNVKQTTGLGDVVEKVTKATGIKKVVDAVSEKLGVDCGCDERKERLNKTRFFAKYNPECVDEEEYKIFKDFLENTPYILTNEYQVKILEPYNRIFHLKQKPTGCGSCWEGIKNHIKTLIEAYDREEFI